MNERPSKRFLLFLFSRFFSFVIFSFVFFLVRNFFFLSKFVRFRLSLVSSSSFGTHTDGRACKQLIIRYQISSIKIFPRKIILLIEMSVCVRICVCMCAGWQSALVRRSQSHRIACHSIASLILVFRLGQTFSNTHVLDIPTYTIRLTQHSTLQFHIVTSPHQIHPTNMHTIENRRNIYNCSTGSMSHPS